MKSWMKWTIGIILVVGLLIWSPSPAGISETVAESITESFEIGSISIDSQQMTGWDLLLAVMQGGFEDGSYGKFLISSAFLKWFVFPFLFTFLIIYVGLDAGIGRLMSKRFFAPMSLLLAAMVLVSPAYVYVAYLMAVTGTTVFLFGLLGMFGVGLWMTFNDWKFGARSQESRVYNKEMDIENQEEKIDKKLYEARHRSQRIGGLIEESTNFGTNATRLIETSVRDHDDVKKYNRLLHKHFNSEEATQEDRDLLKYADQKLNLAKKFEKWEHQEEKELKKHLKKE